MYLVCPFFTFGEFEVESNSVLKKEEGHPKKWCKHNVGSLCFARLYFASLDHTALLVILTSETSLSGVIVSWEMMGRTEIIMQSQQTSSQRKVPQKAQFNCVFHWWIQPIFKVMVAEGLFQIYKDQHLDSNSRSVSYSELKVPQLAYCIGFALGFSLIHT